MVGPPRCWEHPGGTKLSPTRSAAPTPSSRAQKPPQKPPAAIAQTRTTPFASEIAAGLFWLPFAYPAGSLAVTAEVRTGHLNSARTRLRKRTIDIQRLFFSSIRHVVAWHCEGLVLHDAACAQPRQPVAQRSVVGPDRRFEKPDRNARTHILAFIAVCCVC